MMYRGVYTIIRLEPIMLKNLPIIPSRISQKFYPLFLIYSQIITYYSLLFFQFYWVSKNNVQNAYETELLTSKE